MPKWCRKVESGCWGRFEDDSTTCECRLGVGLQVFFWCSTYAKFSIFFKSPTHPPPLRMKEQKITMVLFENFPEDSLLDWNKKEYHVTFQNFPGRPPPPPFSKKILFISLTSQKIFWNPVIFLIKNTFRKFQKTPTLPLGTLRHMFHQKSICTPCLVYKSFLLQIFMFFNRYTDSVTIALSNSTH